MSIKFVRFEARGLRLVPFDGRCVVACGCGGLGAAAVPDNTQSVFYIWGVESLG